MNLNTPARFGNGFMYAVFLPGYVDDRGAASPEILCDTRPLHELYDPAQHAVVAFSGVEEDGVIQGKAGKVLVGAGYVHVTEGTIIRYHDGFSGPEGADDDEEDGGEDQHSRSSNAPVSPFPRIGR